jgi:hypothetical protein
MNCQYVQYVSYSSMPIQAHDMNHFITSRAYSDCSRAYVWCSTENTVSLFPLSKAYKSIYVALINKLASPDNIIDRSRIAGGGAQ